MPLLDELGLTPRITPERQLQQDQRAALKSLLDPLAQKQGSSSLGIPGLGGGVGSLRPDASLNNLRQAMQAIQGLQGVQAVQTVQTSAIDAVKGVLGGLGGSQTGAPAQTVPSSLSSIIGKRNYQVGRGDPALRSLAQRAASSMGWGSDQFAAWDALINAESGWRPTAQNPTSTAYGLGQFLNSTWGSFGQKTSDPNLQLQYMAKYIKGRYGDPTKALQFHNSHNYY